MFALVASLAWPNLNDIVKRNIYVGDDVDSLFPLLY